MAEASIATIQTLADGGYLVVVTDSITPEPKRLAVDDVKEAADLAATALQPADVGTASVLDVEDIVTAEEFAGVADAIEAILAGG